MLLNDRACRLRNEILGKPNTGAWRGATARATDATVNQVDLVVNSNDANYAALAQKFFGELYAGEFRTIHYYSDSLQPAVPNCRPVLTQNGYFSQRVLLDWLRHCSAGSTGVCFCMDDLVFKKELSKSFQNAVVSTGWIITCSHIDDWAWWRRPEGWSALVAALGFLPKIRVRGMVDFLYLPKSHLEIIAGTLEKLDSVFLEIAIPYAIFSHRLPTLQCRNLFLWNDDRRLTHFGRWVEELKREVDLIHPFKLSDPFQWDNAKRFAV